jgi:hypothetical protein
MPWIDLLTIPVVAGEGRILQGEVNHVAVSGGEIAQLVDELRRAYDGDCWHGPPLLAVLGGVPAQLAATKHPPLAHSIWELVNHVSAWVEVVTRRITERRAIESPDAGDFPPVTTPSPDAWAAALAELDQRYRALIGVVEELDPIRLDEVVPGKDYPVPVMLHGTAQHLAYHAGQIAFLKRLVRVR